jgi:hypothetical protein
MRFMRHANKFGLPIITLVDTPGAYAGKTAEELGQVRGTSSRAWVRYWACITHFFLGFSGLMTVALTGNKRSESLCEVAVQKEGSVKEMM